MLQPPERILTITLLCALFIVACISGCIEDVYPSENWAEDQQNAYVNETFNATAPQFSGAGEKMDFHYFSLHDLITDPALADDRYLERALGVKVTIATNRSLDALENTLSGHEIDATRVARALYSGASGEKIGFVAVAFKYTEDPDERILLKLDAKDVERFSGSWKDGAYIRFQDWSEAALYDTEGIARYEDPESWIRPLATARGAGADEVVPYGREVVRNQVGESTEVIVSILYSLQDTSRSNDYHAMREQANTLLFSLNDAAKNLKEMPFPEDCREEKEEYLAGMEELWKAGSCYWYGATFIDAQKMKEANTYLSGGLEKVNGALESLSLSAISGISPTSSVLGNALSLGERSIYQDAKKINDISLRITNYGFKDAYILMNGESEIVRSGYGYKYLWVTAEITHMGFYGGGSPVIKTPLNSTYSVIYRGEKWADSTPKGRIQNFGILYTQADLNREESYEGVLLFRVPEDLRPEEAYIEVDVGNGEKALWKLA
ncbi:MAG: hypothetical protein RQ758_02275 [Methanomicrobiaceae archaeon]|nr:hypothetical protein [Methanomicrobiaceae archaeon]